PNGEHAPHEIEVFVRTDSWLDLFLYFQTPAITYPMTGPLPQIFYQRRMKSGSSATWVEENG
ncbi:hypothetical protein DQ138_28530, partial [Escherichia coli]|nr:hypothetical protein [Escherichia coli]